MVAVAVEGRAEGGFRHDLELYARTLESWLEMYSGWLARCLLVQLVGVQN